MDESGNITVSTGVVFGTNKVPVMVFDAINRRLQKEKPRVPTVYIQDKDRSETNPNDPDYLEAVAEWEKEVVIKLIDAAIVLGLNVISVPEGFPTQDDDVWSNNLKRAGVEVGEDRFLTWVKMYAAPGVEDLQKLILACSRQAGVTEEDVADAATLFPGGAQRGTDTGPLPETLDTP